ncbi:MAG: hypothetical protein JRF31_02365 [Deltaproteobacteria bacterium]|nr:hypothetical protein [Deltaproteobacteria bacterium]OQY08797.1 MAG: hypothetical protein B6I30_10755 [Desulfobacteraceae bacterium 4572_187]MBW1957102.1 hypothetical protein [Deltaproteobacteria bacterium]MBW2012483.1 hypothetical protein [Deltaproteobacteria bacterium]MBW2088422.1 hypothetical protein [Deltaproteobacteria bacterium]
MNDRPTATNITLHKKKDKLCPDRIWIISKGRYTNFDLSRIWEGVKKQTAMVYNISELARYLLNPNPLQIKKKLVGCEIHYRTPLYNVKENIRKLLPQKLRGLLKDNQIPVEVLKSDWDTDNSPGKDDNFESHLNKITELLRPYNPIIKSLNKIDPSKVFDVVGICEDIGGHLSNLNIPGSIMDKLNYIRANISKDVGVILEKAYIADGLFEMKGFNFKSFDKNKSFRLIRFLINGISKACVLDSDNKVEFWIDDIKLVQYMLLFDQLIEIDPKLNSSLSLCTAGKAEPLKLLFSKPLEIDYSEAHLPEVYKGVFEKLNIGASKKNVVKRVLNKSQVGISFNYVPMSVYDKRRLFVNFSVMHNFKALEPIKNDLPLVYSEINKIASVTEAGKFYLLDSFRGYKDDK